MSRALSASRFEPETGPVGVSHVLRHARQVMLGAMRRDGFYYRGELRYDALPWDVNNGYCEDFAELACRLIPGADAEWLDDDDCDHCAIVVGGRYYDAEAIDGVDDWRNLPIFEQQPRPE